MRLFVLQGVKKLPEVRQSLAIDPGFRTSGFSLIDFNKNKVKAWSAPSNKAKVMGLPFPYVLEVAASRIDFYIKQLERHCTPETTEVVLEFTHLQGEFSVGMCMLNSLLVQRLFEVGVPKVVLIPNRIAQFFMKMQGVSDAQIKRFVEVKVTEPMGKNFTTGKISPHSADAILFHVFVHNDFFRSKFDVTVRIPEIEFTTMRWSHASAKETCS
jgi:hypothetical protein